MLIGAVIALVALIIGMIIGGMMSDNDDTNFYDWEDDYKD